MTIIWGNWNRIVVCLFVCLLWREKRRKKFTTKHRRDKKEPFFKGRSVWDFWATLSLKEIKKEKDFWNCFCPFGQKKMARPFFLAVSFLLFFLLCCHAAKKDSLPSSLQILHQEFLPQKEEKERRIVKTCQKPIWNGIGSWERRLVGQRRWGSESKKKTLVCVVERWIVGLFRNTTSESTTWNHSPAGFGKRKWK